jgi:prevent-host-death family protein
VDPVATTKLSSREFNQDTGRAKRAARKGPVIITERGRPAHVLLTFDAYQRLANRKGNILDALGLPKGVEDIELEIPTLREPARPADLR